MRLRDRIQRFMIGRYGMDQFTRFLSGSAMVFIILSLILSLFRLGFISSVFSYIGIGLIIYSYFRMFSRNFNKRYMENQKFLQMSSKAMPVYFKYLAKAKRQIGRAKYELSQRKIYHIYRCPSCSQKIRIPRGKGKIQVKCPKCYTEFIKKS